MKFKPVSPIPNFSNTEQRFLKKWYSSGLIQKYLKKNQKAKNHFSFLDGPITANNPMGVHHAWGRTLKDLFQRYKNMQGFAQRFQNGFDCQGLWVEVEVEKELGFKSKRDIEQFGIARFVNLCKKRVKKYSKIQTEQSKRLGYFMDWGNSYYTMSNENNYMIWYFLKKCWQDGNLYKGRDSVPWCPRCETAISQHEILQEEYRTLTHKSVVLKLPAKDGKRFLAWTTTPWSIPGTIALMVHPDFVYVQVKQEDGEYILAKDRLSILKGKFKIIKEFKGKELVGKRFLHPYQDFPALAGQKFPIIPSKDFVILDVGTGIVTDNPGVGHEDFLAAKAVNLSPIESVDASANFLPSYSWLSGRNAKDEKAINEILEDLKRRDFVYDIYNFTHRYPICWRCKTELVFRLVDEWYIAMDDTSKPGAMNYREKMIEVAKKIRWIPGWGLERELDWLKNMQDWLISKKRYWGLTLPIWECRCGYFEVIGSKEELKKRATNGWKNFSGHSPHRPWVDQVKIKCPKCGQNTSRIPDVGNPWLDAGIVSFSTLVDPKIKTLSYTTDKKYWQKWFPADFVTECFPGQFKNWFYSLIAMSTVLEGKPPFKTLFGYALVRDEKGEEMHKSKGNALWFNDAAEKMGVDVMRWLYLRNNPTINVNFGYQVADKTRQRFHLPLYNIYRFFVTYANFHDFNPQKTLPKNLSLLDKWALARLSQTGISVTQSLDRFNPQTAAEALDLFVTDLSAWYVRRSRDRVMPPIRDEKDKNACLTTLHSILLNLSQLLAPFIPFLSENIHENLTFGHSVHLTKWPSFLPLKIGDKNLLKDMDFARKICELGHAQRKLKKIKVRQPLPKIQCTTSVTKPTKEILQLIKDELNVKDVVWKTKKGKQSIVRLSTKITPELEQEGQAREIIRQIQDLRKKSKYKTDQKIAVTLPDWPKKFEEDIKQKTLALKIKRGKKITISPNG
jgi:isoleucyl-tRNA synthetase